MTNGRGALGGWSGVATGCPHSFLYMFQNSVSPKFLSSTSPGTIWPVHGMLHNTPHQENGLFPAHYIMHLIGHNGL
jgi:hypothetical protein